MWFRYPPDVTSITVQQQSFGIDYEVIGKERADATQRYFRAPDHFAPLILDLPGFVAQKPEGADVPADLPTTIPGASGAVDTLTGQLSSLKDQLEQTQAALAQAIKERDLAIEKLKPLADELDALKAASKKAA